jgi:hypothetical protein
MPNYRMLAFRFALDADANNIIVSHPSNMLWLLDA